MTVPVTPLVGLLLAGLAGVLGWVFMQWRRAVAARFERADTARRPRGPDGVVLGAEPLHLIGTTGAAVLVLHGFNDTPQSMRYLAERLHAAGYSVLVPRLPGHGCALPELARDARALNWHRAVRDAYAQLAAGHDQLFLCGQSMGGALAVHLTVSLDGGSAGFGAAGLQAPRAIALLAPFIGMAPGLGWKFRLAAVSPVPYFRSSGGERSIHDPDARRQALSPGIVTGRALLALREVALTAKREIGALRVPTLYVQSVHDNRISQGLAEQHFRDITATVKRQIWLKGCGHIISADYERERVADEVIAWFDGVKEKGTLLSGL